MAKTCYYELLGIERTANDSDIKKAYRRQALVWHPDKNHENVEETTRVFAEIKEAYETLSDPQERAWYDNHREQILRGDDYTATAGPETGNAGSYNHSANVSFIPVEALMKYFSLSAFRDFNESDTGFYTVYRGLFDRLRDEELQVYDPDTEDKVDLLHNLGFGDSHTIFDEDAAYASNHSNGQKKKANRRDEGTGTTLRDFYNFWTTFATRKSFGWFDKYRLSDAENRQIRRLMEKENKALRDKAKREFVEAVQKLAAWLKKRDPRYKNHLEEQRVLQVEKEKEQKRRAEEQRAAVVENSRAYEYQTWEKVDYSVVFDEYLSSGDEFSGDDNSDDDDEDVNSEEDLGSDAGSELDPADELVCFVCDKAFKSFAQKTNHEQSKKHQKAERQLRREMLREERQMAKSEGLEAVASSEQNGADNASELSQMIRDLAVDQATGKGKKKKKNKDKKPKQDGIQDQDLDVGTIASDVSGPSVNSGISKKELRRERQKKKSASAGTSRWSCNVCSEQFISRNQLFQHINATGHALAVPSVVAAAAIPQKPKTKKKK